MAQVKHNKVTALPGTLETNAFYYVVNNNYCEMYLTTSAGTVKMVGNTQMIDERILAYFSANVQPSLYKVANIAARDALTPTLGTNAMILVADASADANVDAGAAMYFWDDIASQNTRIAEYESLDVILSWANLQDKPTSSVADIDDAVAKKHSHTNIATLNKWSESAGSPLFDGSPLSASWQTVNW